IVIPADASELLKLVAADTQEYLRQITGVEIPIITPEALVEEHKCLVALGMPEIKDALVEATGEFAPEEYALNSCGFHDRQTIAVVGGSDVAVQYGTYALLEMLLGVRFFHPHEEFVPKNPNPFIGRGIYWREKPHFALRGMEPQTRFGFPEFAKIFADPQHVKLALEYIDYLAKNRQNVLALTLPAGVDIAKSEYADYYGEIFARARLRGISIMLGVSWGDNRDAWSVGPLVADEVAQMKAQAEQRLKILCDLGPDIVDIDFGIPRGAPSKAVSERIAGVVEFVQELLEKNYPEIRLYVRTNTAQVKLPEGVGEIIDTGLCRDLATPFMLPDRNISDSRLEYKMIREASGRRPFIYSPATSSGAACGLDLPLPNPLYIYLRSSDAEILSLYRATGQVHTTHGLEWLYWLNDYAAMRYNWDPERWNYRVVLRDYTSIFGTESGPVIERALLRMILAFRQLQLQMQLDEYLWFWSLTFEPAKRNPAAPLPLRNKFIEALLPFMQETAAAAKIIDTCRDKVPENAREWYDETADVAALSAGNAQLVLLAAGGLKALQGNMLTREMATGMRKESERVQEIFDRRVKKYRYPGEMYQGGDSPPFGGPGAYLEQLKYFWERER
ncbi:MAG: hypothetical protein ABIH04_05835, partial [Planctomycetota bacterium]